MKSITNFHMGSREARSPFGLVIRGLIRCVMVLIVAQTTLVAQDVRFTKPSWYFGVAGGANFNFYRGTTQRVNADLKASNAFRDGSGVGLFIAPLIEFHRPDTKLGFMLQAGYDSRKGKFKEVMTPCNCPADLSTDLSYITIEPSVRFAPFRSNFYLYGGPRFAFNLAKSFTYSQGINPDYPEQIPNPDVTGDFTNVKSNLISIQIGAGYDFPLSSPDEQNQLVLSPFVSFHPYFGQEPRSIESWNITTVRIGAAFKFGHGQRVETPLVEETIPIAEPLKEPVKEPVAKPVAEQEVVIEPVPEPVQIVKPEVKPEPVPVVVKSAVVGNVYTIYFGNNKSNIDSQAASELDRLAVDLNENPTVKIEIKSYTDSRGSNKFNMYLSKKRGKSVTDYLASKGIFESRVKSQTFGENDLVNKCADGIPCTEAEQAENRRTEIVVIE